MDVKKKQTFQFTVELTEDEAQTLVKFLSRLGKSTLFVITNSNLSLREKEVAVSLYDKLYNTLT